MKIVIIIPTYNEAQNIEKLIGELQEIFWTIKGHDMHILVVDGNSPDGTAKIVQKISQKSKNVHLHLEKAKKGLGAAYTQAMKHAFEKMNADVIFTFDADFSHDPKVLPEFVKKLENGAAQVIGTRYRKGGGIPQEWGIHRKLLSVGGNLFISLLYFGKGVTDFTGGYKAITRRVYDTIKDSLDIHKGYTFAISTNLEALQKGFKIEEVPFYFKDRTMGKSKMEKEYFFNALKFVIMARIQDFLNSRFGRVFIAGGIGGTFQLLTYAIIFYPLIESKNILAILQNLEIGLITLHPRFLTAQLMSIEIGLFTSFSVNNMWAFKDKKLSGLSFIFGFLKTNVVASGAILIQVGVGQFLSFLFSVGFIRNNIYQIIGILVGLIWNFYFYKKIIWKVKKK